MLNKKGEQGFTLIELLVVISAIGLISSIAFVAMNDARMKARDAKRVANKNQVIKAISLYQLNTGTWPDSAGRWDCIAPASEVRCWNGAMPVLNSGNLETALKPYMNIFPDNNAKPGYYAYNRLTYTNGIGPPTNLVGVYIVWMQERSPAITKTCPVEGAGYWWYDGMYYYCLEQIEVTKSN